MAQSSIAGSSRPVRSSRTVAAALVVLAIVLAAGFARLGCPAAPHGEARGSPASSIDTRGALDAREAPAAGGREAAVAEFTLPEPATGAGLPPSPRPATRAPTLLVVRVASAGGSPLPGIEVTIEHGSTDADLAFQAQRRSLLTDQDGTARFENWPNGVPCAVSAKATPEHRFRRRVVYPPVRAERYEIVLRSSTASGLRGRLVRSEDGTGVAGAIEARRTRVQGPTTRSDLERTDAEGFFALELSPGAHRWTAGAAERSVETGEVEIVEGLVTDLGDIRLGPAVWLSGRIVDEQGRPKADCMILGPTTPMDRFPTLDEGRTKRPGLCWSDAEGRFRVPARSPGEESHLSVFGGHRSETSDGGSQRFGPFRAPANELLLVWRSYPEIRVKIEHPGSGRPIRNGQAMLYQFKDGRLAFGTSLVFLDPELGAFRFRDVPPGESFVKIFSTQPYGSPDSFGLTVARIEIPSGVDRHETTVSVEPETIVHLEIQDTEGSPIAQLPVQCDYSVFAGRQPERFVRYTEFDGKTFFACLGVKLRLRIDVEGFEPWEADVDHSRSPSIDLGVVRLRRTD